MPVRGKAVTTATPRVWSQSELNQVMMGTHATSQKGIQWWQTKHDLENLTDNDLASLRLVIDTIRSYDNFFALTINRLTNAVGNGAKKGGEYFGKKDVLTNFMARKSRLHAMTELIRDWRQQDERARRSRKNLFPSSQGRIRAQLGFKPNKLGFKPNLLGFIPNFQIAQLVL